MRDLLEEKIVHGCADYPSWCSTWECICRGAHDHAGADRFVFGMVEGPACPLPDKDKERQERVAARQKLLEEKAAARQQRIEVHSPCRHLPPGLWLSCHAGSLPPACTLACDCPSSLTRERQIRRGSQCAKAAGVGGYRWAAAKRSALTLQTLLWVAQMYCQRPDFLHAHHVAEQNGSSPPADPFKLMAVMF